MAVKIQRPKSLTKRQTAETRTIETSLLNKDEVFRMLALAESTGLPLLLIGPPGVAKTKTVLEYAKAWMLRDIDKNDEKAMSKANEEFMEKIYILETDEDTKSSEVKGMPDMESLFLDNKYELVAPITDAEVVIINEIDKASTNIRNALLGIMNEKFLFNGKTKLLCKWKLFIGTCNSIPKDELDAPFWDRFVLKMQVNRITAGEFQKYFKKGGKSYRETFHLGVPSKEEAETIAIPHDKMEKFIDVCYSDTSDRTLTFVPILARTVAYIWNVSADAALVKVCSLMVGDAAATELKNQLLSPGMKVVLKKVDMLKTTRRQSEADLILEEVNELVKEQAAKGALSQTEVDEVTEAINFILANHEFVGDMASEAVLDDALEEENYEVE